MKNILIINRKGGVGKTLVADELAFALDAKNVPYCFYDLDGQGGTLHEPVEMDDADISIIDTPGSLQGEMGEWVKDADVVIIPMRPSVTDMPATETTIDLVKRNAPDTPIVWLMVQIDLRLQRNLWNFSKKNIKTSQFIVCHKVKRLYSQGLQISRWLHIIQGFQLHWLQAC